MFEKDLYRTNGRISGIECLGTTFGQLPNTERYPQKLTKLVIGHLFSGHADSFVERVQKAIDKVNNGPNQNILQYIAIEVRSHQYFVYLQNRAQAKPWFEHMYKVAWGRFYPNQIHFRIIEIELNDQKLRETFWTEVDWYPRIQPRGTKCPALLNQPCPDPVLILDHEETKLFERSFGLDPYAIPIYSEFKIILNDTKLSVIKLN